MTFEQEYKKKTKMKTINGKKIASNLNEELKDKLQRLKMQNNIIPTLVVILVGR